MKQIKIFCRSTARKIQSHALRPLRKMFGFHRQNRTSARNQPERNPRNGILPEITLKRPSVILRSLIGPPALAVVCDAIRQLHIGFGRKIKRHTNNLQSEIADFEHSCRILKADIQNNIISSAGNIDLAGKRFPSERSGRNADSKIPPLAVQQPGKNHFSAVIFAAFEYFFSAEFSGNAHELSRIRFRRKDKPVSGRAPGIQTDFHNIAGNRCFRSQFPVSPERSSGKRPRNGKRCGTKQTFHIIPFQDRLFSIKSN